MSQSTGNDSNAGTLAAPWKTLAKLANYKFRPGDFIFLKKGDTWTETMQPSGDGDYASGRMITLTGYGTGDNPKIAPGGAATWVIRFPNSCTGGWKIDGIDVSDGSAAGIAFDCSNTARADGYQITNCNITRITGMAVPASGSDPVLSVPDLNCFCGTGVMISRVDHVNITNVTVTQSDMPVFLVGSSNSTVNNLQAIDCHREGIWVSVRLAGSGYNIGPQLTETYTNVTISNSLFRRIGDVGVYWGVAGIQINGGSNVTIQDCEVDSVSVATSPDMVGIDVEGYGSDNVQIIRCNVHDCDGAGLLIYQSSGATGAGNTNTQIKDSTFARNGGVKATVAFMRLAANNETNNVVVTGNTFTRYTPVTQKLNNISDASGPPQGATDSFPTRFTVSGNTITN